MLQINGNTRVLVHLAYPSGHLRTPQLFNHRCAERAIDAVLVPWQVHPDNLANTLAALRDCESVAGMLVTIPHKESIAAFCDKLSGPAEALGVVNVIRRSADGRLEGRILDGEGFVGGLRDKGHQLTGRNTLLVGAGGVALAIAGALANAGIYRLRIANRTPQRAKTLIARLKELHPDLDVEMAPADANGFDLVVNATSVGMNPDDPLPVPAATLQPDAVVAEVIMAPPVTALLKAAKSRGAIPHEGVHMLTGQIDPFIDFVLQS